MTRLGTAAAVAAIMLGAQTAVADNLTAEKLDGLRSYAQICGRYEATAHACGVQKLFVSTVRRAFLAAARSDGATRSQAAELNGLWLASFSSLKKARPTMECSTKARRTLKAIAARCATLFKRQSGSQAEAPRARK